MHMNWNLQSLFWIFIVIGISACGTHLNEVIETDENGKIVKKYLIDSDKLIQGELLQYNVDGQLAIKEYYVDNKLSGERYIYHANDSIQIKEVYTSGIMDGPYVEYFENGKPLIKATYVDGVLTGILTKYYADGQIEEEVTFANNEENGLFKEYYNTGILHWEGTYKNGDNEVGLLTEYNKDGQMIKKMMCDSLSFCKSIWTIEQGDIKVSK